MTYSIRYLLYLTKQYGIIHLAWHVHYSQIEHPILRFFWKPVSFLFYQNGMNHSKIIDGKHAYHCLGGKATRVSNDAQFRKSTSLSEEQIQARNELDRSISDFKERKQLAKYLNSKLAEIDKALNRYPRRGKIPQIEEDILIRFGKLVNDRYELSNLMSKTSMRILYQFYTKYFSFRFFWYPDWAY